MQESDRTIGNHIGFTLSRVIVPLWVLTGALFKLYERTPSNLPGVILKTARDLQLDLEFLLRVLIGLELFAALVMFFVPRLARSMAIFMLSCFVIILLVEMYRQATKCGCFGSIPVKPWHMLLIDGALLVGVIAFNPRSPRQSDQTAAAGHGWTKVAVMSLVLIAIGLAISFAVPARPPIEQAVVEPTPVDEPVAPADPQANPSPAPVPNSWYVRTTVQQEWVGKSWREVDLFKFMPRWPKGLDQGKHYVVFFSRTCEHCESMFKDHFGAGLDAPVTAVQIPNSRDTMTAVGAWEVPPIAPSVEILQLPLGCNYIVTPPLALTIIDGQVTCAVEGEGFESCLGLK